MIVVGRLLLLLVTIFLIMATYRTLRANTQDNLDLQSTKDKIGTLYTGLDTSNKKALDYTALFLLRRLLFAMIFEYIEIFILQSISVGALSIFLVFYLSTFKPFIEPSAQFLEIFNETIILMMADLSLSFSKSTDGKSRYQIGWIYIGYFLFLFGVNLLVTIRNLGLIKACKRR